MIRLEGSTLTLRGGRNSDVAPLFRYISDPSVKRFLALVPPKDEAGFAARLKEMMTGGERDYYFVIARRTDNAPMGIIRLHWNAVETADVSYWLGVPFWGNGYAPQAVCLIAAFAFTELGLSGLTAFAFGGNSRSMKVLHKLGFEPVSGHLVSSNDELTSQELQFGVSRYQFVWTDPTFKVIRTGDGLSINEPQPAGEQLASSEAQPAP